MHLFWVSPQIIKLKEVRLFKIPVHIWVSKLENCYVRRLVDNSEPSKSVVALGRGYIIKGWGHGDNVIER